MSFQVQCTSFSGQKGTRNKTSFFFMKANLCPILPYNDLTTFYRNFQKNKLVFILRSGKRKKVHER